MFPYFFQIRSKLSLETIATAPGSGKDEPTFDGRNQSHESRTESHRTGTRPTETAAADESSAFGWPVAELTFRWSKFTGILSMTPARSSCSTTIAVEPILNIVLQLKKK